MKINKTACEEPENDAFDIDTVRVAAAAKKALAAVVSAVTDAPEVTAATAAAALLFCSNFESSISAGQANFS